MTTQPVLITAHAPTEDAAQAIAKLRFMLRMRGVGVLDGTALGALSEEASDKTSIAVLLDTTASAGDEPYRQWMEQVTRVCSEGSRRVVLLSGNRPGLRPKLPDELQGRAVTRLDRPLGFHRACAKLRAAPFVGICLERSTDVGKQLPYIDDTPTDDDKLGRDPLVERVHRIIERAKRPMTISVEGPWGSGKSSFLKRLEQRLASPSPSPSPTAGEESRAPRRVHIVDFNPWRLDKAESLWASFAVAFYDQLYDFSVFELFGARRGDALRALRARVALAWSRYDFRRGALPAAKVVGMVLAIVVCIVALASPGSIRGPLRGVATKLAAPEDSTAVPAGHGARSDASKDDASADKTAADQAAADKAAGDAKDAKDTKDNVLRFFALFLLLPSFAGLRQFLWSLQPIAILKEAAAQAKGPDYEGKMPFIQQFQEDFAKVVKAFEHVRVVVVIDDIDRCELPVAAELCQAMNVLIPDWSDMVFIIAMDREKVAAGLAARAEKILPILAAGRDGAHGFDGARALDYGFQFLEKSVQLSVRLPPARTDSLGDIVPDGDPSEKAERDELRTLVKLVAGALGNNPRRVKHFINVMSLNTHLLEPDTESPVTRPQLAKLLAITLRWPRLVPDIADEPTLLADLEELAVEGAVPVSSAAAGTAAARWARDEDLFQLLRQGLDGEEAHRYTFLGVDVPRLLGARRALLPVAPVAPVASVPPSPAAV